MLSTLDKIAADPSAYPLDVDVLGECRIPSPVRHHAFVDEGERVYMSESVTQMKDLAERLGREPSFERAGPHKCIFHDPAWTRVGILTAGGLCPGLNNVIKGLVEILSFDYGIKTIFGIRFGYAGLNPQCGYEPLLLNPDAVDTIHEKGGTVLGSSRGKQPTEVIVDTLVRMNINVLFCIGGDGSLRCAREVAEACLERHLSISVVGVPKTIDNDLQFVGPSFGFETAVAEATSVIRSAHVEAKGTFNGVGLVKLMGRDSGFIAAYAALATTVVNFCLIPEVPFTLEGLFKALESRYSSGKTHAVIAVAEGAGQELFKDQEERRDASGNILKNDIGEFLTRKINEHFKKVGKEVNIKYFDPSYMVRSIPAKGTDAIFCFQLAESAVHAGMAGKTDMVVGSMNEQFSHVPIEYAVNERKKIDPNGTLWHAVLGATRQQDYFSGKGKGNK